MQYTRVFIPLSCETTGYEYKGKTPAGRCLLEARSGEGKLLLWAQDLKPEALYRVYMIFPEGGTFVGIPLSGLTVKSNGKAELRHSFNPTDIEGFGRNIDNCSIVAILVAPGTSTPLCGYRDTPITWRKTFKKLEKTPPKSETKAEIKLEAKPEIRAEAEPPKPPTPPPVILPDEVKVEKMAEKPPKVEPIPAVEHKTEPEQKQTPKVPVQITPEELEALAAKGEVITLSVSAPTPEPPIEPHTETPIKESGKKAEKKADNKIKEKVENPERGYEKSSKASPSDSSAPFDYFGVKAAFEAEVEGIMRSNTRMYPFRKQKRSVHWARISLDEDLTLPEYANDLLNTSFVENAYRQYSHLLLGKTADDGPKRYYIGVPSIYDSADKIVGFRQFKSCENETPTPGDYGYWLIFMS